MKYCVPYYKTFKYMEEVDEIIVPYTKEDINFIKSLTSKEKVINNTVIIEVKDMYDFYENNCIEVFKFLKTNYTEINFKLKFEKYDTNLKEFYNQLKKDNIDFFFALLVRDWDSFNGLLKLGVSDVYIVEELGFSLGKLGPMAHAKNVSIRCYANVAQSMWKEERSIKSFFIRPEDADLYTGLVDVIEFFGDNQRQYETLYKIYAINKKWSGPLKEIILGLESDVDSRTIVPGVFIKYRLNCEKRCAKGSKCSICERFIDIGDQLLERGVIFNY